MRTSIFQMNFVALGVMVRTQVCTIFSHDQVGEWEDDELQESSGTNLAPYPCT